MLKTSAGTRGVKVDCGTAICAPLKQGSEDRDKPLSSTSPPRFEVPDEYVGLTKHNLSDQMELRGVHWNVKGMVQKGVRYCRRDGPQGASHNAT